jgi:hypothetical protein
MMTAQQHDSVTDLLLAYWQGEGPADRATRDICRRLTDRLRSCLPPNVAQSLTSEAPTYAPLIGGALADLIRRDPETQALVRCLSPVEPTRRTQIVRVDGNGNVVVSSLGDIEGLKIQVLPEPPGHEAIQVIGGAVANSDRLLTRLRQILATRFDLGELRTLCFDLGIDYDDLPGEGKANKARELVACLDRHGRIPELLRAGEQLRPDISWSDTH